MAPVTASTAGYAAALAGHAAQRSVQLDGELQQAHADAKAADWGLGAAEAYDAALTAADNAAEEALDAAHHAWAEREALAAQAEPEAEAS